MITATGMLTLMHPVIRIFSFIVLSLFLSLGDLYQLSVAVLVLGALFLLSGPSALSGAWPMLRRMRWFFLSILLIYTWLTPGQPLWGLDSGPSWWMPSREGVLMGGHRVVALLMIVLALQWLLWATPRTQLVSALYWLATPLSVVGIPRERLVVRIALILTTIERVQIQLSLQMKQVSLVRGDLRGYAAVAAELLSGVAEQGESEACQVIEMDLEGAPPLWQWLWPLSLIVVMLLAA